MAEEKIVRDPIEIKYHGVFNAVELYRTIKNYSLDKGYTPHDLKYEEEVVGKKRRILAEVRPYKNITNYMKYRFWTIILIEDMEDVVIEKDGKKVTMQHGEVIIKITGLIAYDWTRQWEAKPWLYFLREIFDKYIFRQKSAWFERVYLQEYDQYMDVIKAYLNLYRSQQY